VGAGGGSIAHVDAGGSLRVGPQSAGATPGPACYGRGGTKPTVTDAHLVLGRLHPNRFLGGAVDLDVDAAYAAFASLGDGLNLSPKAAAQGVLRVANATMERALRRVSVERGHDPRDYVLMPFGGAGPLHACALADALGIHRIVVPPAPGVLSALGLCMADVVHDATQAILRPADALIGDPAPLAELAQRLTASVRAPFELDRDKPPALSAEVEARYAGQSYELTVPMALPVTSTHVAGAVDRFHAAHRQRYGHALPDAPVEIVTLRLRGTQPGAPLQLPRENAADTPVHTAQFDTRPIWFDADAPTDTPCYDRTALHHGHRFDGPAAVYQYDTSLIVPAGWTARVDAWRTLHLNRPAAH
jgi:N-methylhydantoinase A